MYHDKIGHAFYELDSELKRVTYTKKIHVSCLVFGWGWWWTIMYQNKINDDLFESVMDITAGMK